MASEYWEKRLMIAQVMEDSLSKELQKAYAKCNKF